MGDSWSLIVLRDIVFGGRRHFRELLTLNDEGIASNMLAARLHRLVDEGLLTRADTVRGQKATYTLTEAGIQVVPVMVALGTWGMNHRTTSPELTVRARILAESPELVDDLMDELRETHLGAALRDPTRPRASQRLQAEYEAALGGTGSE
nr:helix-turn-helix domain-containing protein [Brevibacterium marinum]